MDMVVGGGLRLAFRNDIDKHGGCFDNVSDDGKVDEAVLILLLLSKTNLENNLQKISEKSDIDQVGEATTAVLILLLLFVTPARSTYLPSAV